MVKLNDFNQWKQAFFMLISCFFHAQKKGKIFYFLHLSCFISNHYMFFRKTSANR